MLRWLFAKISAKDRPRTFTIHTYVEAELIDKRWGDSVRAVEDVIKHASSIYEKHFGIGFLLTGVESWELPKHIEKSTRADADEALRAMRQLRFHHNAEITLAFVHKSPVRSNFMKHGEEIGGFSDAYSGCAIIGYLFRPSAVLIVTLHEIGHLFGAKHSVSSLEPSVMDWHPFTPEEHPHTFDKKSVRAILVNKHRLLLRSGSCVFSSWWL